jgi:hypothetical protein
MFPRWSTTQTNNKWKYGGIACCAARSGSSTPDQVSSRAGLKLTIYYAWHGKRRAQLVSPQGKSVRVFEFLCSGPNEDWLEGSVLAEGEPVDFDFGHKKGDFLAFTVVLVPSGGTKRTTFFVGWMKGKEITGTFVDDIGTKGKWTAIRTGDNTTH